MRGVRVLGGRRGTRRIGKILKGVFDPDAHKLVGYLVSRPDFLWMVKRDDRFLAYDAFKVEDGRIIGTIDRDSWDAAACKRLGIDWDCCLLLEGMPIVSSDGYEFGVIDGVEYDERSGKVQGFAATSGITGKALLGTYTIPHTYLVGYRNGTVVVKPAACEVLPEGGLAAKAGEGVAVVSQNIQDATAKVGKAAGKAVDKASIAAGKALGKASRRAGKSLGKASKQAGKSLNGAGTAAQKTVDKGAYALGSQLRKSKGMFSAFKDEYNKEAGSKTGGKSGSKTGGPSGGKSGSKASGKTGGTSSSKAGGSTKKKPT